MDIFVISTLNQMQMISRKYTHYRIMKSVSYKKIKIFDVPIAFDSILFFSDTDVLL